MMNDGARVSMHRGSLAAHTQKRIFRHSCLHFTVEQSFESFNMKQVKQDVKGMIVKVIATNLIEDNLHQSPIGR